MSAEYLLAELRCAALRARLWQADIEAVGVALRGDLISPEQAVAARRLRLPAFGRHRTGCAMNEAQIQRAVLDHLRIRGVPGLFFLHIPNGGLRLRSEAARLKGLGTRAGAPDLLLIMKAAATDWNSRCRPAEQALHGLKPRPQWKRPARSLASLRASPERSPFSSDRDC